MADTTRGTVENEDNTLHWHAGYVGAPTMAVIAKHGPRTPNHCGGHQLRSEIAILPEQNLVPIILSRTIFILIPIPMPLKAYRLRLIEQALCACAHPFRCVFHQLTQGMPDQHMAFLNAGGAFRRNLYALFAKFQKFSTLGTRHPNRVGAHF